MASLSFSINQSQVRRLEKFFASFPWIYSEIVKRVAVEAKDRIIRKTPVKTGAARRSWRIAKRDDVSYVVVSDRGRGSAYTPFLEFGTGVFGPKGKPIRPVNANWLVFPIIRGNTIESWVKTKEVQGFPPFAMVQETLSELGPFVQETGNKVIHEVYERAH